MQVSINIITIVILFIGLFFIFKKAKLNRKINTPATTLFWTALCFTFYSIVTEIKLGTYYFFIPFFFFGLFLFSYFKERRRLINGLLFNLFFITSLIYLGLFAFQTQNVFFIFLAIIELIIFLLISATGLYILIIFLYWNAKIIFRKEQHSLANLLTLLLAIGLTTYLLLNYFLIPSLPLWAKTLLDILPLTMAYFLIVFYNFLTISVIYQFNQPKFNQDFIIVLGAGLINGKTVPPLLGKRIDRAIQFYQAQIQKGGSVPKIIMSGGKGSDEQIAESIAMKNYALDKNIPEQDILVETESTNTLENMKFSKNIMEKDYSNSNFNAIFVTNNFHLFRAGLFAKIANLNANGLGAKTAFYFLPNAFLREFIAIIFMKKRQHIVVCAIISLLMIFLSILQYLLPN